MKIRKKYLLYLCITLSLLIAFEFGYSAGNSKIDMLEKIEKIQSVLSKLKMEITETSFNTDSLRRFLNDLEYDYENHSYGMFDYDIYNLQLTYDKLLNNIFTIEERIYKLDMEIDYLEDDIKDLED